MSVLWSPDGKRLVFSSSRGGRFDLYQMAADGQRSPEVLYTSDDDKDATSWSPDGKFLTYETSAAATSRGRLDPAVGRNRHTHGGSAAANGGQRVVGAFSPDRPLVCI